jgi:SecD/SecF fusion protein
MNTLTFYVVRFSAPALGFLLLLALRRPAGLRWLEIVFILVALAVLGGDSLADFSVALLAGVVIGTASTVFTAVPIAVQLEGSRPAPPVRPRRSEDSGARSPLERGGRARDSGAVV